MKEMQEEGKRHGGKSRKVKKTIWEMYHMDHKTLVFRKKRDCPPKKIKNVKNNKIGKKTMNEIRYVGNVSQEPQYSEEVHVEEVQR